jgi:hypothetical protein
MAGDNDDLRLPFVPGPVSNGEFLPAAAGAGDIRLARTVDTRVSQVSLYLTEMPG